MNKKENGKKITFPGTTGNWGTVTHFSFFDAIVDLRDVEEEKRK